MTVQRLVVPEARLLMRLLLLGAAAASLLLFTTDAEARRCGHGQIKRVSLGICVGRSSRAARGFVRTSLGRHHSRHHFRHRHSIRRHYREPVALEPEELPDDVKAAPMKTQERVERSGKTDRAPQAPPEEAPDVVSIPTGISGSLLMRPPVSKTFDWLQRSTGGNP